MNNHFFFDGYELSKEVLAKIDNVKELMDNINNLCFDNNGKIVLIPYFNGKIKEDGGVSGIIISSNQHFTCHTFCYKHAMFVDYYGDKQLFSDVRDNILKVFPTNDYDLCLNNKNVDGNFGKHLIYENLIPISFNDAKHLIKRILVDIEMTPINDVIINYIDEEHFDLLQPIAESHISLHRNGNLMIIDAFSCKWFDEEKLSGLLKSKNYKKICRGVKYK